MIAYCDRTKDRNMYCNEIKYFAGCVEKGVDPEVSMPRDTINSIKMVMAELESADKDGEKISI